MEITDQLGNLLGVAFLSVLGSLLVRRLGAPARVVPLVPVALAVLIVAVWGGSGTAQEVLAHGGVSGLLASGLLYILLGLSGR